MSVASSFDPVTNDNVDGWGPSYTDDIFDSCLHETEKFPFEVSLKIDKLSRVCDFTQSGYRWQQERARQQAIRFGREGGTPEKENEEDAFQLVDSRPAPKPKYRTYQQRRPWQYHGGRGGRQQPQEDERNLQQGRWGLQRQKTQQRQQQKQLQRQQQQRQQRRWDNRSRMFREWSVQTKPEWQVVQEIPLAQLPKQNLDASKVKVTDLKWCGDLRHYDRSYDRITEKTKRNLTRYTQLQFYNPSTTSDINLREFLADDSVQVIVTDSILSMMMAASRSVYSWDIIVIVAEGKIVLDKREDAPDLLTVNENAQEPPAQDAKPEFNQPQRLAFEASLINQNFSQQVLDKTSPPVDLKEKNPFAQDDSQAASCAFRYRKFTVPGNDKAPNEAGKKDLTLVVRATVDAKMPTEAGDSYCVIKALNEYDPKVGLSWRKSLDSQRGAVLADEIRNNANKLGRWVAQANIAGADTLKLGFVTRTNPKDPTSHQVLNCQTYLTNQFASQIGLTENNAWGVVRSILDLCASQEDGKYLLLKDPNKPIIRLYQIAWEDFAADDEDEEDVRQPAPPADKDKTQAGAK
mmetsp:Transcript_48955/g.122664  ORF Transcript_48955/g.122664 Transcript_48955/m.122664 type:complete len:576 (-) Transcript_48955:1732-3459(-)